MGKKALGRGLSDILKFHNVAAPVNAPEADNNPAGSEPEVDSSKKIVEIEIDLIDRNPYQPRTVFNEEELTELANSIKQQGLIQPIVLRKVGDRYQIISGERRTRASKLAGFSTIKAQVYENLDDKVMSEWALIENIQRVDLNPVEIARSYQKLIDNYNYTHEDLAKAVGKSRSAITNALRLLKLPEVVLAWIEEGKIAGGAARALCSDKIADPEALARRIIDEGLNVRQIEAISRGDGSTNSTGSSTGSPTENDKVPEPAEGTENSQEKQPKPKPELSADMKSFENRLETFFGTKVQLNPSASKESEGTIVIKYYSMDDLTRIQQLMENH